MKIFIKYRFFSLKSSVPWFLTLLAVMLCFNKAVFGEKSFKIELQKFVMMADESLGNFSDVKVYKYNRTASALNGSFELYMDLDNDLVIELQGYEKVGNTYVMSGIHIKEDLLCNHLDAYRDAIFFPEYNKTTNLTLDCPIKKGTYFVNNYRTDEDDLPDDVPGQNWRLDVKGRYPTDVNKYLFHFQAFVDVIRQVPSWNANKG